MSWNPQGTAALIERAEHLAVARKFRLTPLRRRVLEIMLQKRIAVGAYELLPYLRHDGFGASPMIVYRTLDFLMRHDLVHKVEGLHAFVACSYSNKAHVPVLMVCRDCRHVAETSTSSGGGALDAPARAIDFAIERTVIEAVGLCADCRIKDIKDLP